MSPIEISPLFIIVSLILMVWTMFWKGVALWRSARQDQLNWFIAFIIITVFPINLLAIPEIIYLFFFAKKRLTIEEVKSWTKYFKK